MTAPPLVGSVEWRLEFVYLNQSAAMIHCIVITMAAPTPTPSGNEITWLYMFFINITGMHVNLGIIHGPEFGRKWLELGGHKQKVAEQRRDLFEKGGLCLRSLSFHQLYSRRIV